MSGKYEDESNRRSPVAQFYLSDTDVGPSDKSVANEYDSLAQGKNNDLTYY